MPMKILDVDLLQDGLQRNIAMLERLQNEVGNIQDTVKELVAMEEVLKGAGGSAIRGFYSDVHLPFLHFFLVFSDSFKQKLQQVEAALISLEPDAAGYILEQFLEGELEQGLTLIANITERLTNEANSIMDSVSDIVALPHLNDSEVQEGVQNSKKKRDDTVLQLHEFDASQTTSLNPVEQNIQTMGSWLADMEGMFKAGVKDIHFQPSQWNALTFGSGIRTELFPKVYLDPNSLWVEEHEKMIGTMISTQTFQALDLKRMNTIEENVGENVKYHQYANGLLIKEYSENGTVYYEIVSKVEYKEEVVQVEPPKENKLLDGIQFGLDLVGLIPGIGEIADGANGIIYTARGDKLNATLSFGAMIPFAGWGSTGAKFVNKGSKFFQPKNVLSDEAVESVYTSVYRDVVNSPLGGTQTKLNLFTSLQNGTPNALAFNHLNSPSMFNMPTAKMDIPTTSKSTNAISTPSTKVDTAPTNKSIYDNVNKDIMNVDVDTKGIDNAKDITKLTVEDIPTAKSGHFNKFFNSLTSSELDELWKDKKIRKKIERQLREPGGLHEWHLVSRAPQFKYWNIGAEEIKDLRTAISDVKFVNPNGVHGGLGSTKAHNELLAIIDTSSDYNTFVRRLNNWANYRLEGGVSSLPQGLRLK